MNRTIRINLAIAAGAVLVWLVACAATGGVHPALGVNGAAFETMVRHFTLKGGDKPTRLSPLLPALTWLPYAVTHDVKASFTIVNGVAIAVLAFAACLLLDTGRAATRWKVLASWSLAWSVMFGKMAAFSPADPHLIALAAVTLSVALAGGSQLILLSAANVAAVMALPIGLVAPLFSAARGMRRHRGSLPTAIACVPALLMWLFVQWWARGGVAGALSDFTPRALFGGVSFWTQPLLVVFAVYFLVTAAGGLSLVACGYPGAWRQASRRSPELPAFVAAVALCAIASPFDAPMLWAFLAPAWLLVCVEWSGLIQPARAWWWWAAVLAITVFTQRPLSGVDAASALVNWQPFDAYRAASGEPGRLFWDQWVTRLAVTGAVALALAFARTAGRKRPVASARLESESDTPARAAVASPSPAPIAKQPSSLIDVVPSSRWAVAAYAFGLITAVITAYFLFGVPIQLTDSFENLLAVQDGSAWSVFTNELHQIGYLRPLLHVQLKIVYDLSRGDYFTWFRSVQAIQVLFVLVLSVRLLRPTSILDAAVLPCALAMVLGIHTFAGTIREAFPINTFLTLVLCCLAAANLSQTRGGWIVDVLAAALLAFSLLTLETGILVWVIVVAGYIAGARGVSRRGLLLTTAVLGGYFAWRVLFLHVAPPSLSERASGFGFSVLQPSELTARFAANPLPFYAYNYLCAIATVLFAEPRGAVWSFVADLSKGSIPMWELINVVTSTITTGVLAWHVANRLPSWRRLQVEPNDRLVLLFLLVLPVNALLCVVYVKDVIMSPAGVFYALAATIAIRELLTNGANLQAARVSTATIVLLAALSAGWGWRMLGIHYSLRERAEDVRAEWGYEDEWEVLNHTTISTPHAVALKKALLEDAMWRRPAPPRLTLRWPEHWFDKTQ